MAAKKQRGAPKGQARITAAVKKMSAAELKTWAEIKSKTDSRTKAQLIAAAEAAKAKPAVTPKPAIAPKPATSGKTRRRWIAVACKVGNYKNLSEEQITSIRDTAKAALTQLKEWEAERKAKVDAAAKAKAARKLQRILKKSGLDVETLKSVVANM